MENSRGFTVKLLSKLEKNMSYSNILLNDALEKSRLDDRGKKFASALFYGVLERRLTLDEIILSLVKNPKNKLNEDIRNILRTALYQLVYMDSVPDNAAVDEAVKLAKKSRNPSAPGFVNGMLREFIRRGKKLPEKDTPLEQLAVDYSAPLWLVKKWNDEYGEKVCRTMLETSVGAAPVFVKANTLRLSRSEIISILAGDDCQCEICDEKIVKDALVVKNAAIEKTKCYKAGLIHSQDLSCQLCCKALEAKPGDTVLDLCAAPGGKTFTIAENMENKGRVLAFDLHENRVKLISDGAKRLGLSCVETNTGDAKKYNPNIPMADKVLCDVPCSGLGVIRRKPEIKYKNPTDFERLPEIQLDILQNAAKYVKPLGRLVYSTCTLSKAENEETVEKFLEANPAFRLVKLPYPLENDDKYVTITPDKFGSDGFFIAAFVRTR